MIGKFLSGVQVVPSARALYMVPGTLLVLLFIIAPLVLCLITSLDVNGSWSLANYERILFTQPYLPVFVFTMTTALTVALLSVLVAFPACILFNKEDSALPGLFLVVLTVSFTVSVLVRTYAWHVVLAYNGLINNFLLYFGFADTRTHLLYTKASVIVALVQIMVPYAAMIIFAGVRQMDRDVILAARTLGAGPFRTFYTTFWPQIRSHVVMAILIVFATTSGFFVTPALLGGPGAVMIAMQMHHDLVQNFQEGSGLAAASAVILTVFLLGVAGLSVKLSGKSFFQIDKEV